MKWTDTEICWLEVFYARTSNEEIARDIGRTATAVGLKARQLGLSKDPDFAEEQLRKGQFRQGQTAWNAGMKGLDIGGKATRFQAGNKPHTWLPVGTEVTDPKDGYLKRKVRDDFPRAKDNWAYVHRLVWEEHNGPIPEGHIVVFRDGDKTNITIDNLECIHRADNVRRNGLWNRYPRPLAEAIHVRGQLNRRIRERSES